KGEARSAESSFPRHPLLNTSIPNHVIHIRKPLPSDLFQHLPPISSLQMHKGYCYEFTHYHYWRAQRG
ncbi:TPA: hypothetical protein ACISW2_001487, partial [Salmonella enterica subsp. enterica serovar Charity]